MKKINIFMAIAGLVLLVALQSAQAGTKHYTLVSGEKDFYYGFISYLPEEPGVKSPEIFRSGLAVPETATLNFPLAPGDVVVTYDKPCEIQFDSGTIVRLGTDTKLKIETIMAQTLSSGEQLSNLFLEKGRIYLMYTAYNSWEIFQLLTPTAALKMKNHTVILAEVAENGETRLVLKEGNGNLLFGPSSDRLKSMAVKKGESLVIRADNQVEKTANFPELADFEAWNEKLNKEFLQLHKGITPLPKPIQKLPAAVFYFAQNYGNQYGQWIWDDFYGYVWRPYYNDVYPWGNWSPYFYGRWSYVNGSLFWIPEEPWGWVPYHLGIWQWDKKLGWVWIPGSVFAPAWVDWEFYFGLYSWRPWSMLDWLFYDYYGQNPDYFWYLGGMTGGFLGQGGAQASNINFLNSIRKDQLKKPQSSPLPIPGEYKSTLKSLSKALAQGNPLIIERLTSRPPEPVAVKGEDLVSDHLTKKIIPASDWLSRVSKGEAGRSQNLTELRPSTAEKLAVVDYLKIRNQVSLSRPMGKETQNSGVAVDKNISTTRANNQLAPVSNPAGQPVSRQPIKLNPRFRDWNPDLRVARQLGIHVLYDSSRNSIVSPELRLSSKEAKEMGLRVTPSGIVQIRPAFPGSTGFVSGENINPANITQSEPKSVYTGKSEAASSNSSGSSSHSTREKH
jgi:hypothetical protein